MLTLRSPDNYEDLLLSEDKRLYVTKDGSYKYPVHKNVVSFLPEVDSFYEGAYLNRVRYVPKFNNWFFRLPLWFINGGYMKEVLKSFSTGDVIVELGCASGVDLFGEQFQMIGIDLSLKSLLGLKNYQYAFQTNATKIPLLDSSVDGIISSYFWEHIPPNLKDEMLLEFNRILKPGGKIIFLYDVETENGLLKRLKQKNIQLYKKMFLEKDGHLGYESPLENKMRFERNGFIVTKHFGMERTWLQSNSVYIKLAFLDGFLGLIGRVGKFFSSGKVFERISIVMVRIWDETFGRLWPLSSARIIITIAIKNT